MMGAFMKKFIALMICLISVFGLAGCDILDTLKDEDNEKMYIEYIVLKATESHLLVAEIGEDGSVIEMEQYSVPNAFYPSYEIAEGDKIVIKHNGVALETFPMQFAKIYSMTYHDSKTGLDVTVELD